MAVTTERFAILAQFLNLDTSAHHDRATTGHVGLADTVAAKNGATGRKVRSGDDLAHLLDRDFGIVEIGDRGINDFAEVMRRNIGCHADGNAAGAIDKQIGKFSWQNGRFPLSAVVVFLKVDGFLVEIVEKGFSDLLQAALRVAHRGRWIAVDRAKVTLTVNQRQAQRKVLREADQGVIDRVVAMRVVFAHHVADDAGRLLIRAVVVHAHLVHPVKDATVNGLEAIADIRQGTRNDDAHCVIEIRALHLINDGNAANFTVAVVWYAAGRAAFGWFVVRQSSHLQVLIISRRGARDL